MNHYTVQHKIGILGIWVEHQSVVSIEWGLKEASHEIPDAFAKRVLSQLCAYFDGTLQTFDVPLTLPGSEFRQAVYREMLKIPYGQTVSYGYLAKATGHPKASRVVGQYCHNNPLAPIVPCHRVIQSDGSLGGYYGGAEAKQRLLDFEASHRKS